MGWTSWLAGSSEARIAKLEQGKLVISEKLQNHAAPRHRFEELFELAFDLLRNPWKLWNSGQLPLKRTVLRLAFREQVAYGRNEGLRTPKTALPFKLLGGLEIGDLEMARLEGETSNAQSDTLKDWNNHLRGVKSELHCRQISAARQHGVSGQSLQGFKRQAGEHFLAENHHVQCWPMCRTAESLVGIEAILSQPTVDGIFMDPSDLSLPRGRPNRHFTDEDRGDITTVAAACAKAGKD